MLKVAPGLPELYNHRLEQRLDRVGCPKRSVRREISVK
jgi:hypothetical protein